MIVGSSGTGVRPCRRSPAKASAACIAASATATPCTPTPSRALFIIVNIAAMPWCGSPIIQPRDPSNSMTQVGLPCSPILCSSDSALTPFATPGRPSPSGRNFGTRKSEIPRVPGAPSGSRASTRWQTFSATSWSPQEMKIFCPLTA